MRKFLQWSLVTLVAVVLMAVVVGQMLATTTGRARDASVAVLKEKLARLEAERVAVEDVADQTAVSQPAAEVDTPQPSNDENLRDRWLAMFQTMETAESPCKISDETWNNTSEIAFGMPDAKLSEEETEEIALYLACSKPSADEVSRLCEETDDLGTLINSTLRPQQGQLMNGAWRCTWRLRSRMMFQTAMEDQEGVVESFSMLLSLNTLRTRRSPYLLWDFSEYWIWRILDQAIKSGDVEDEYWERILVQLEKRRNPQYFAESVEYDANLILNTYENWTIIERDLRFQDEPVTYLRTWAYPRLTPALFNHDVDVFSRAMDELLELSRMPFHEAKPGLDEFYEKFDVESGPRMIKFHRSNPAWHYVLHLSRVGFPAEAKRLASIDLIRLVLLLDRYHRLKNTYPESLDSIAEEFGAKIPVSPLDGMPYQYERVEDTYHLGFREERMPYFVKELGLSPTFVLYWHDPLGSLTEGLGDPKPEGATRADLAK